MVPKISLEIKNNSWGWVPAGLIECWVKLWLASPRADKRDYRIIGFQDRYD